MNATIAYGSSNFFRSFLVEIKYYVMEESSWLNKPEFCTLHSVLFLLLLLCFLFLSKFHLYFYYWYLVEC